MKRTFIKKIVGMLLLIMALSGVSCSREKAAEKPAVSPEHAKMIEEYRKGVEESKKIVVARVNAVEISLKELIDTMNQIAPKYIKDAGQKSPETDAKIKKEALDTLVFRELAFQEAKKQGMKVKPEDVDTALKKLKTNLGSEAAFKEYLLKSGLTEALLKNLIERDQLIEMIISKEILQKAKVDEKLVKDTYMKEKRHFVVHESFLVEEVFIQAAGADDAVAMNKAKEALSFMKNNKDISKLAQDKTLVVRNGGVSEQEYPNIFRTAAHMRPGDLSNVIKESDGLHIIRLLEKEPSRQLSFEEARKDIEQKLLLPVINKRKQEWENELKKNAKIEEIMSTQDVMPAPENMKLN